MTLDLREISQLSRVGKRGWGWGCTSEEVVIELRGCFFFFLLSISPHVAAPSFPTTLTLLAMSFPHQRLSSADYVVASDRFRGGTPPRHRWAPMPGCDVIRKAQPAREEAALANPVTSFKKTRGETCSSAVPMREPQGGG